jgi:hypothetical protein
VSLETPHEILAALSLQGEGGVAASPYHHFACRVISESICCVDCSDMEASFALLLLYALNASVASTPSARLTAALMLQSTVCSFFLPVQ